MTDESLIPEEYKDYLMTLTKLQEYNPALSLQEVEKMLEEFLSIYEVAGLTAHEH